MTLRVTKSGVEVASRINFPDQTIRVTGNALIVAGVVENATLRVTGTALVVAGQISPIVRVTGTALVVAVRV